MRTFLIALLGLLVAPTGASADVVISEIAANPALPEPAAEFVVVQNTGSAPVLLDGVRLTDSARAVRGVVPPDMNLEAGQRIALQPAAGAGVYGCASPPYRALLTAWAPLNNTGDTVILEAANGAELDRVAYPADWFAVDGPSRVLGGSRWMPSAGDATPCSLPGPRSGRFRFAAAEVDAAERAPAATREVLRSGGTNGRVAVPWRTVDGSAAGGADYAAAEGSVTFAAGAQRASFGVPLIDDDRDEPDETFTVVLGGGAVTEPTRAVVRVLDDDAP